MADKGHSTRIIPALDPEALARAERAVAALGDGFVDRFKGELVEIRAHAEALAQTADAQKNSSVEAVLAFAHDPRGQGGTFGYPLLSEIGNSLTYFLEHRTACFRKDDADVLHAHFDAAAAILSNATAGEGNVTARALIGSFEPVENKILSNSV